MACPPSAAAEIRMMASNRGRVIAADLFGKAKTVSQMVFIGILYLNVIWGLFGPPLIVVIELLVAALTLASGFNYLRKNLQIFKGGS